MMKMKKVKDLTGNDLMRIGGVVAGGFAGFAFAEFLDDTLGGAVDDLKSALYNAGTNLPGSKKNIGSVEKKFQDDIDDKWASIKLHYHKKLAYFALRNNLKEDDIPVQMLKEDLETRQQIEFKKWFENRVREMDAFIARTVPSRPDLRVPWKTMIPDDVIAKINPYPDEDETAIEETLKETGMQVFGGIARNPLVDWIFDHPLHTGCVIGGAVIGEQAAEHKEVVMEIIKIGQNIVPKELKAEVL